MKICFIIPFHYQWESFSNVKSHYEYLKILGHEVKLFSRTANPTIDYNSYDQVWLMGTGAKLTLSEYLSIKVPVIAFGWSDPNLFSPEHAYCSDLYFTNDLQTYRKLSLNSYIVRYYQTSCDKRYHKNLNLEKTTDILVYGIGNHKFIPNRNEVVNQLRQKGFNIKIFGRGWDKHEGTFGFIKGQQFIEEINKAKVVLDITNNESAWGHRIFESSACGTPVLTCSREDTRQVLNVGWEVLLYKTFEEIVTLLDDYLNKIKTGELEQIGLNAQKRCYRDHDISVKVPKLLQIIKERKVCNHNI